MMTGLLITDTNDGTNHPQYITASTTTTFDNVNDRVMVKQDSLNIYSRLSPDANTNDWYDLRSIHRKEL